MPQEFDPTQHALGALPNGTLIQKSFMEPGDLNPMGSLAKVIGSIVIPDRDAATISGSTSKFPKYGYFVEWETIPERIGFVLDYKISPKDMTEPEVTL